MSVNFKLYASNGSSLIHTFSTVFQANYPHTEKKLIEHENVRGKGSIIVDGGDSSWTLTLRGVLFANDYDSLMALVDTMESSIVLNTPYVLKILSGVTTHSYNCKRIVPIIYQEDSLRTNFIEYTCELRCLSW